MGNIESQTSVNTQRYCKNIRNYIDGKDAILRSSQNIINEKNWYNEMFETREAYGHNKAARRVRNKKTGELQDNKKVTMMYHQVIALLPEDADINGGKMTPEMCMEYAKQYTQIRYPNQQIIFALHKEHCENDDTYRYAIHMVINRTNLETGKRLDEGKSVIAKQDRAKTIRELDKQWNLKQVERGVINSKIHLQQPRGAEKYIVERGEYSYKNNLRKLCNEALRQSEDFASYQKTLKSWGVKVEVTYHKIYAVDTDNPKYKFRQSKLDPRLTEYQLNSIFRRNKNDNNMSAIEHEIMEKQKSLTTYLEKKDAYMTKVKEIYTDYRVRAKELEGTNYEEFPIIKIPKVPSELRKDKDVTHQIFDYIRKGDNLRDYLSANKPYAENDKSKSKELAIAHEQNREEIIHIKEKDGKVK